MNKSESTNRIDRLIEIMAQLRHPETGCPWDLAQDFKSIAPCTIEEAYEVAEAIEREDFEELPDELGDLLFQVVFYARLGEEAGKFSFNDIVDNIVDKLERRHPHIFGDAQGLTPDEVAENWEKIKRQERRDKGDEDHSLLAGVSHGLPEFTRCLKLQKRAARVGFEWPDMPSVLLKLDEEIEELKETLQEQSADRMEDELGDVLLVLTNVARRLSIDPAQALRRANSKFEMRFRAMEKVAASKGQSLDAMDLEEKEALWQQVKRTL